MLFLIMAPALSMFMPEANLYHIDLLDNHYGVINCGDS